jgi:hypothetical protein
VRQREALFSDRDRLLAEVIQRQRQHHLMWDGKVGDKPAIDVLADPPHAWPFSELEDTRDVGKFTTSTDTLGRSQPRKRKYQFIDDTPQGQQAILNAARAM